VHPRDKVPMSPGMNAPDITFRTCTITLSALAAVALPGSNARADDDDDDHSLEIEWSTYFGGKGIERDAQIAVTTDGGVVLAGLTNTNKGLATSDVHQNESEGEWDALLVRFDDGGDRKFATYFGGDDTEHVTDIAVNKVDSTYLVGATTSDEDIAKKAHQDDLDGEQDGFIAKFDDDGDLLWATYVGGDDEDAINAVALDSHGDVYVCGWTESDKGLATDNGHEKHHRGEMDAFIARYTGDGSLVWATYLGGKDDDACLSIAVQDDKLLVGGWTASRHGIATKNTLKHDYDESDGVDGFVALFDLQGHREWGTLIGGNGKDLVESVAFDFDDDIYVAGSTGSKHGIATSNAHQKQHGGDRDLFIVKLGEHGKRKWGTYYGGDDVESNAEIVVRKDSEIYLAGQTESHYHIATEDALYGSIGGQQDVFVAKFSAAGKRHTATYFGGDYGEASPALVSRGEDQLYLACTTNSHDAPLEDAFDDDLDGLADLLLAKLEE
jgi:hypothetical protein